MQSSSTFIRISGPIQKVLKNTLINIGKMLYMLGYIMLYAILGKIRAKRGVSGQVRFVPNAVEGLGVAQPQENFAVFTLI